MKRIVILGALFVIGSVLTTSATAATPVPFPSDKVQQVFIAAQTVTSDGSLSSWFAPGSSVVFRAYAVGGVDFKILIKVQDSTGKVYKGQFVQMPSATAALSISTTPAPLYTPGGSPGDPGAGTGVLSASLYVDTVNGSGPVGIAKRPVGCSLTNVYKRGEQVVLRVWGTDLLTTNVLSNDNVSSAHFSIAGQPDVALNYGAHGTIYFWANAWVVPANYPLGATTIHVVFNLESGKSTSYDYVINVIPT